MGLRLGYEIKGLIPLAFCERCNKQTRHKFSYTRKSKHRLKRWVYFGCSCGVSLSRVGYLDENKNIIFDKDRKEDMRQIMMSKYKDYGAGI
jgi:hypothetical protein